MAFSIKRPTDFKRPAPPLRAALWALLAVCGGVGLAYYWRVFYALDLRAGAEPAWAPLRVTALCVLGALALAGAAAAVRFGIKSFSGRGAACIALCGLLFVFANPPMQTPDENQYYLRCDAISRGYLDFDAARAYPADVTALYNAFPGAWVNAHTSQGELTDEDTGETESYTTAGYALKQYGEDGYPQSVADSFAEYERLAAEGGGETVTEPVSFLILPFLPPALGMALARLLGFGALGCFYAGRMANLAAYTALCWLALRATKRFRPALLAVMLLPLSLFMAGSLSYDATLLGCYYLMAALLTRETWDTSTAAAYLAACVYVNVAKPYLNLLWVLLPLALPKKAFCAKGKRRYWLLGMLLAALAATALTEWYGTAFRTNYPAVIPRMGGEDVDGGAQLAFILQNPLRFVAVLLGTLYENDGFLGQLGLFGWKDLPVQALCFTGLLTLAAGAVLSAPGQAESRALLPRRTAWGAGAVALVYAAGAMTAMYITYTPVSMVRIVGLQARYFLPVWLLLMLPLGSALGKSLAPRMGRERAETLSLCWFAPAAVLGALLIFQHYYIGPVYTIG